MGFISHTRLFCVYIPQFLCMVLSVMNKLTTKSAIIEKECQWIKTDVLPELTKTFGTLLESEKILVLVQGKLPVVGKCIKYHDKSVKFCADGFNGDWVITHWMYIPTLPLN